MTKLSDALKQYLPLAQQAAQRSHDGGNALLGRINQAGLQQLQALEASAARPKHSLMPQTDAATLLAPDYGVNIDRVNMPVDVAASFHCGVPRLNSLLGVVANDIFMYTKGLKENMPAGLTVCSLRDVPAHLQDAVASCLSAAVSGGDAAQALNAALLTDGVLIHAAEGFDSDRAVQIVNISAPAVPMLSPRRIVIMAEANAKVKVILCDHSQTSTIEHLNLECIDLIAREGAEVELYTMEEGTGATRTLRQIKAQQQDKSRLTLNGTFLSGGISKTEYDIDVQGSYAHTRLGGLGICTGTQVMDVDVTLKHKTGHSTSEQLFKNALFDQARGAFGGKIIVSEGAVFTDASQTNRNLLIGDDARMTAAPQLEIYCDEVKCSHGATTGQLDERALFYMQSRGIPAAEARRMLTQAFMADVIDQISYEVLRQRLHVLVEKRLNGEEASCESCASSCHHAHDNE